MSPPGRAVAAVGSALRAFVLNVAAVSVLGGLGAGVATFAGSGADAVASMFGLWLGVFFGAIAGGVAGAVHAVAQLLLMPLLPPHRRRPVSPAVATVVSAALAIAAVARIAAGDGLRDDATAAERAAVPDDRPPERG